MRVSDSMLHNLVTRGLAGRQADYYEAQETASSGLRVAKPSDDPVAAGRARSTRSEERRQESLSKMAGNAIDRLQAVSETITHAGDVVSRARELAVLGANDHLSMNDRAALAVEVSSLRSELLSLSNSRVEGEYVFGGLALDRPPFDGAGTFSGETTLKEIEIGPGLKVATQVAGDEVFGTAAGSVSAFETLDALEAALVANDSTGVHDLLDDIETSIDQIAQGQTTIGARQSALQQAKSAANRVRDEAIRRRAKLTEASPVDAFTELMRAEGALREALSIASRMPPPSMVGGGS